MKPINKSATKVFFTLVKGLAVGEGRKINNAEGSYMPVSINKLGENHYSIAHNFVQNGDLMTDPDMEFVVDKYDRVFPVSFEMSGICYRRGANLKWEAGRAMVETFYPREQRDQATFAGKWMINIKRQQGL